MNFKSIHLIAVFLYGTVFFCQSAGAHPGAVDSSGGHIVEKTGKYHYHKRSSSGESRSTTTRTKEPESSPSRQRLPERAQQQPARETTPKVTKPRREAADSQTKTRSASDYFRAKNENAGALDCGVVIHARNVDVSTKRAVRKRDGNRCVICGSKVKLEVDHARGLQNGGTNDLSNLALLCGVHHAEKTKYDSSLKRKRESVCRRK